jgi:cytochrome c peroxidase
MARAWLMFIALGSLLILSNSKCEHLTNDPNLAVFVPAPADNPATPEKVALGKKLFFDKRLSLDGTVSCASCHDPHKAFSDQLTTSIGIKGQRTERNAPSILNSGFLKTVMFDAHLKTLELQVIVPLQEPTEMGHNMKKLIPQLRAIPEYQAAAQKIFQRDFDAFVLTRAIGAFERSLVSMNSRFDQYQAGNKKALSKDEQAGWKLFSKKLYCIQCHPAPYFTTFEAANNGLYLDYGKDKGRFRINLDSSDIGKFKIPSLRNSELTFPYMHDGSLESIDKVIEHYIKGGKKHPLQDKRIVPFELTTKERKQLTLFLKALTDTSYLKLLN